MYREEGDLDVGVGVVGKQDGVQVFVDNGAKGILHHADQLIQWLAKGMPTPSVSVVAEQLALYRPMMAAVIRLPL